MLWNGLNTMRNILQMHSMWHFPRQLRIGHNTKKCNNRNMVTRSILVFSVLYSNHPRAYFLYKIPYNSFSIYSNKVWFTTQAFPDISIPLLNLCASFPDININVWFRNINIFSSLHTIHTVPQSTSYQIISACIDISNPSPSLVPNVCVSETGQHCFR